MKNKRNSILWKMIFFGVLTALFIGCTPEDDPFLEQEQPDPVTAKIAHLRQVNNDGQVVLNGRHYYSYFAMKTGEVLREMYLECEIILDFLEGQNIKITLSEETPVGLRTSELFGKMTPSGQLKFSFPVPVMVLPDGTELNITDIIQGHLGCEISGPGISQGTLLYQGNFDGERLEASAFFNSKCNIFWEDNDIFDTPVDGPVHATWAMEANIE